MAGSLMHGSGIVGTVTSGGTESILCAVAAYRDRARTWFPELGYMTIASHSILQRHNSVLDGGSPLLKCDVKVVCRLQDQPPLGRRPEKACESQCGVSSDTPAAT